MLATVSQTRSLVGTYYYDRALNQKEKGGQVIASNGIPQWASAKTQLAYMQAYCSDKYQVKAINVVLSHSSVDKKLIGENPDLENKCVNDFLQECKDRGINLENTPWIIMKHVNTDCIHYHMIILTTMFNGKRLDTGFIGMRASKAAWATSKKNGLHYALGIDKREQDRLNFIQETLGEEKLRAVKSGAELSEEDTKKIKEATSEHRAAAAKARKERRAKAKAELDAWKAKLKGLIEGTANYFIKNDRTMEEFFSILDKNGMLISKDNKGRYNVTAKYHGRLLTYKATRLEIDTALLNSIKGSNKMDEYLRDIDELRKKKDFEEETKRRKLRTAELQVSNEELPKAEETKDVKGGNEVKGDNNVKAEAGLSKEELAGLKEVTSQNTATATKVRNTKRAKSVAEANERKEKIKNIIESNADYCLKKHLSMRDLISLLEDNDIHFSEDENGNYSVTANNGKRDVTYKVARLGVDASLFESIKRQEEDERQSKLEKELKEQERKEKELKEKESKEKSEKDKQQSVQTEQRENKPRWHIGR